jgi:hypothetical protein
MFIAKSALRRQGGRQRQRHNAVGSSLEVDDLESWLVSANLKLGPSAREKHHVIGSLASIHLNVANAQFLHDTYLPFWEMNYEHAPLGALICHLKVSKRDPVPLPDAPMSKLAIFTHLLSHAPLSATGELRSNAHLELEGETEILSRSQALSFAITILSAPASMILHPSPSTNGTLSSPAIP